MHGGHSYEYDARGFLTKEDSTIFAYDANGNITQAGSTTMSYDTTIKDRLVKVGTDAVVYDDLNPLNPKSFKDKEFTFEGRRLVRYKDSKNDVSYKYNGQGLRIEKTCIGKTPIRYLYDGYLLISEVSQDLKLEYLYDDKNELYGFIKDNSERYFYLRDSLSNIIGIVDINGIIVVKYNYTAFGQVAILMDTANLANINHFLYKGYYYDQESGMYYCHTRYYVPEWCRWLNSDNIVFLENNAPTINLFRYCTNNPVSLIDEDGTLALSLSLIGLVISGLFITSVAVAESNTHFMQKGINAIVNKVKNTFSEPLTANNNDDDDEFEDVYSFSNQQDPYKRKDQKKQGRELKNKSRGKDSWTQRNGYRRGPKPPKKHTPGRDHRKFLLLFAIKRIYDLFEELDMDRS